MKLTVDAAPTICDLEFEWRLTRKPKGNCKQRFSRKAQFHSLDMGGKD